MSDFKDLFKDAPSAMTRIVLDGGPIGHYETAGPGAWGKQPVVIRHMQHRDVVVWYTGIEPEKFEESKDPKSKARSPLLHWDAYCYSEASRIEIFSSSFVARDAPPPEVHKVRYVYARPATLDDLREAVRAVS